MTIEHGGEMRERCGESAADGERTPLSAHSPSASIPEHYPIALFAWLSPGFPIGSFAFSHGLEYAVANGDIHSVETTYDWIAALLDHGGPRNDVIFVSIAMQAALRGDLRALREANELCLAMAGGSERLLETTAQGNAFMTIILESWSTPAFQRMSTEITGNVAYPIAIALAAAAYGMSIVPVLQGSALAIVQNLVSTAIRLSAIGQTGAQRIVCSLVSKVIALAAYAETSTLDDLGNAAFRSDIAAMKHETQQTRLFRS